METSQARISESPQESVKATITYDKLHSVQASSPNRSQIGRPEVSRVNGRQVRPEMVRVKQTQCMSTTVGAEVKISQPESTSHESESARHESDSVKMSRKSASVIIKEAIGFKIKLDGDG